jgi:hypothetical protein
MNSQFWVRIVAQIQRVSARSLSTETANLKGAAAAPSVAVEKIKYFKIYRWDPEQNQKPYLVRGQKCVLHYPNFSTLLGVTQLTVPCCLQHNHCRRHLLKLILKHAYA